MKVYVCPINHLNCNHSLEAPIAPKNLPAGHYWALNDARETTYRKMRSGDICIFGNAKLGFIYAAKVQRKCNIHQNDDSWPFRSPSGRPWSLGFKLSTPKRIHISYACLRKMVGNEKMIWQQQCQLPRSAVPALKNELLNQLLN